MPVSIGPRLSATALLHLSRRRLLSTQISRVLPVAAPTRSGAAARHLSVTSVAASTRRSDSFTTGYTSDYPVPSYGDGRGPIFDKKETGVLYPRDIKQRVDQYVVGQEKAKKVICTAIFNHIKRLERAEEHEQHKLREKEREQRLVHVAERDRQHTGYSTGFEHDQAAFTQSEFLSPTQSSLRQAPFQPPKPVPSPPRSFFRDGTSNWVKIDKNNLLFLGPTGSGKTYLLETVSKLLDLPLVICDCNALTQAGYIGQDVESCIQRLLIESNFDVQKAQSGIVVLDEFDKLARKEVTAGRDVAGEGVQQALLSLVHGTNVTVTIKESHKPATPQITTPFSLQGQSMLAGAQSSSSPVIKPEQQYTIDTSNIMFVFCGAFGGLEKIIKKRVAKSTMGFRSASQALESKSHTTPLPWAEGKEPPPEAYLDLATPSDLQAFGIIPELLGRIHDVCNLGQLSVDELYRILTEPVNNLVAQYQTLMRTYPSEVFFTKRALRAIAKRAADSKKGARGLNTEMLRILRDGMFIAPLPYILVTEACVEDPEKLLYWGKDGRMELERIMREEDGEDTRISRVEQPRAAEVGGG